MSNSAIGSQLNSDIMPVQQPILLQGGALPPLNVFHNPVWMSSSKAEDSFNQNDPAQMQSLQRLNELNKELDEELHKLKPNMINSINRTNNYSNYNNQNSNSNGEYPKFMQMENTYAERKLQNAERQSQNTNELTRINGFNSYSRREGLDFTNPTASSPLCIRREGMLKVRDVDQKDKDVVVTYAVLTTDRLSYFVNAKDESSIQGSIDLGKIKESLKLINGFPTCFTIKTIDGVSDCSVCAESEDSAREWINAVTQNAVNCNTMSALNNLNKRGLLK